MAPRFVSLVIGASLLLSLVGGHSTSVRGEEKPREVKDAREAEKVPVEFRQRFKLTGRIDGLAFTPDGRDLAAADRRGVLAIWDVTNRTYRRLPGELSIGLLGLAYSPDGKTLALGCADGKVRLLDAANDIELTSFAGHDDEVWSVAFSPDGRQLASASSDQTLRLWDVATAKELRRFAGHRSWVRQVAFSPDGKMLVSGSADETARLWDAATGKELRRLTTPDSSVTAIAFAPDGKTVVVGGGDGLIRFWDMETGSQSSPLVAHKKGIQALAFSLDGRTLASGGEDRSIRLWETVTRESIVSLMHTSGVRSLVFGVRGRSLAAGSESGDVLTWELFASRPGSLSESEFRKRWEALGDLNAGRGHIAMNALMDSPKETVSYLKERLRPVPPVDPERIARWIADLDSGQFPVRKKATAELEPVVESVELALRKAQAAKPSLEMARRLSDLLQALDPPSPARLQALRAVQVLEDLGTAEARQMLESIAKGAPEARLTQEAKAAVRRLGR